MILNRPLRNLLALATLCIFAAGSAVQNAHHLKRASSVYRGWALTPKGSCPGDTWGCGDACCPNDSPHCYTNAANSNICCGTDEPCAIAAALDSRCADTDWVLWKTNKDPICCLPGQIGVQPGPDDDYGSCVPKSSKVPSSSLATKVGSGTTAFIPIPSELCGKVAPPPTFSTI